MCVPRTGSEKEEGGDESQRRPLDSATRDGRATKRYGEGAREGRAASGYGWWVSIGDATTTARVE